MTDIIAQLNSSQIIRRHAEPAGRSLARSEGGSYHLNICKLLIDHDSSSCARMEAAMLCAEIVQWLVNCVGAMLCAVEAAMLCRQLSCTSGFGLDEPHITLMCVSPLI